MKEIFNWNVTTVRKPLNLIFTTVNYNEYVFESKFTDIFDAILKNDWSFIIAITGPPRSGKTTLATKLFISFYKYKGLSDDEIIQKIKQNFVFNLKKEIFSYKQECVVFNEAFLVAYKRKAMSNVNINVIEYLTILQRMNNLLIFVIPDFFQLDKELRNNFVDMIIRIKRRGYAKVYLKFEYYKKHKKKVVWRNVADFKFSMPEEKFRSVVDDIDKKEKEKIANLLNKNFVIIS